ncbi:hypothetical protein AK88_01660 [Plasmodium fragile]|uniref:Ubiquitin-like domain-containing protein n=1 Tax=Plasmodium fragile TaxID=5857 RepID=A0A0D9QND6_PLAFR|nr:uncharacterized protein AK88_01660 [Plasmodium fragile]KJP88580.1 hypothetical protein AK88_01660 [Plasmodium fragile]
MENEGNIKIKIKTIDNEEFELSVKGDTSAEEIKNIIAEKKNVDKQDIRLIYQGQCLANEKSVADYNIQNDHIIHLVVRKKENSSNPNDENGNATSSGNATNNGNAANNGNAVNGKSDATNTNANANANMFRSTDGNVMGDPVHINFSSNVHMNSNSGNTSNGGTASNMPNSSANPNVGASSTPLYFTHMRLTRNDNMDGDLMGQTNICSLLNDIMSQVNINPNFIYDAATAAATAAANATAAGAGAGSGMGGAMGSGLGTGLGGGNAENIFTAAMRTTGINPNASEFACPNYVNGANDKKGETVNAKRCAEAGADGKNQSPSGNKGGDDGGQNDAGKSEGDSSSDNSCTNEKGNDENYTKEQRKKIKKMKKKRKKYNKDVKTSNKIKKNGKYHVSHSSKDDSSSSSSSRSSLLSVDSTMKDEEERKKVHKLKKYKKKKKLKNKYKKKKSYDSSSSSSVSSSTEDQRDDEGEEYDYDEDELAKKEKKYRKKEKEKQKKMKKKNRYLFDPNFLYHQNYMYHPNSISHGRINNHFNQIFKGRNDMRLGGAYPSFVLDHGGRAAVGAAFCRGSRSSLKYGRDDLSDTNENANGTNNHNLVDDFVKHKERRTKAYSSSKALFGSGGAHDNLVDLPGSNLKANGTGKGTTHPPSGKSGSGGGGEYHRYNDHHRCNPLFAGGPMDEQNYPPRSVYANLVPLSDIERNNEIVRNDSMRTNSRVAINEEDGALVSDNNSLSDNIRSIQMSSDRRNSALGRSDLKCLNDANDSEHKNMEVNIPWRVIEQLLVLLEEETGYRRPDLSAYINSYHNSNSIFVFFYLFVHINNIINSIIIQFNHSNFMNNDISMSSFSRISIILSLASVVFSRLSNFFFVFYDNFYCNNYGRHYRYSDPINHEYLRELRNLYYSNNGRNAHSNRSSRFFQNDFFPNGNYGHANVDAFNNDNSSYLHNVADNYYPLPYNDLRNNANRTNLQQEFEDYYKNYLNTVKGNKNMLLRKEFANHKERSNTGECSQGKEDGVSSNRVGKGDKVCNPNSHSDKKMGSRFRQTGHWNGTSNNPSNHLNNGANGHSNNPFSNFPGQGNNNSLLYPGLKERSDEKEGYRKNKDDAKHYAGKKVRTDGHSFKGYSSGDPNESSSNSAAGHAENVGNAGHGGPLNHILNNLFKNKNENRENGNMGSNDSQPKSAQHDDEAKGDALNATNSNFASCDSNMDDMYDVSDDGKDKEEASNVKDQPKREDKDGEDTDGKDADKGKDMHPSSIPQKEKPTDKHTATPQGEKQIQQIAPQGGVMKNTASSKQDSSIVTDIRRTPAVNNTTSPLSNINFSNILNCVQNQMAGGGAHAQGEPPRDKFEGMPEEVKNRYKTWVENTQIFSGQMIKICRNKRPLSNAYIGNGSSKDQISFSNLLPFLWKRNMSTINLDVDLELSDDLLNAFDMHVLEFVKKSIKNNEDYKLEKFKYPTLSLCEKLFDEMDKKDK